MAPHIYVLHNKKPTPFNLIGSMMIIRVLPIHVPPCYEGGYLKPLHWNHIWLMMIIWSDWPIHVPRRCEPLITPHLSLWGNARTRATFPTHKKSHNPHPQGGGGEGGQDGYITLGGGGGGLAKPGSYVYMFVYLLAILRIYWMCMVPQFPLLWKLLNNT